MPGRRQGRLTLIEAPFVRTALAALALLGAAACGGGASSGVSASGAPGSGSPVPYPSAPRPSMVTPAAPFPCTAGAGLDLPADWPAQVPLPAGYVVTRIERRSGDRLIAYGRVPGDFHEVVRFFNANLPAAGFPQRNGQLDPFDAESDFVGDRVQGRWAVGLSPECDGETSLTVLVLPATAPLPSVSTLPATSPAA